jgi:heme exporter protein A
VRTSACNWPWTFAAGVDDAHIDSALERAGLKRQRSLAFGRLSAGQRRRLSLARLMCIDRGLWLLDEPATALDEQGLVLLCSMLDAHLEQGGCAMVATHQALATRHPAQPLEIARWRPMRVEAPQP